MNIKEISIIFVAILTLNFLFPLLSFANQADVSSMDAIQQNAINHTLKEQRETTSSSSNSNISMSDIDGSTVIPETTIEEANQWVSRKGDDLVGLFVSVAEPLSIIGFMVGLFLTLIGGFSKSKILGKGLVVMAISIFVYVGCVFAPEIVYYTSGWLSS